ncbi:MAG TPA: SDR family NAD(P)-dependent oxidoreductase [Candidatus Baltobacteraceae bacterium]|nr:SDR family NAD(P)-dependent oxidoreductase [Candidatus Baltobacteraceae bacterium]
MTISHSCLERDRVALITGASKGFGFAVARLLAERGLRLVITARRAGELEVAAAELSRLTKVTALAGDVADSDHAHALIDTAAQLGRLDLLVNNASTLGASPMPALDSLGPGVFRELFAVNVYAPLHLIQHALPLLRASGGTIVNVSSDAAVQAYAGWGGYGASKAALEHLSRVLAAEIGDEVGVMIVDPGDMRTELHELAEPGEDLSALPAPEAVAPALLDAIARRRGPFERVELQELAGTAA